MESNNVSSPGGLFSDVASTQKEGGLFDTTESHSNGLFDNIVPAPVQKKQDLFDVTVGATEFGAADTSAILTRGVNRSLELKSNSLEDFSNSMEDFKKSHPEYAPTEVQNTLDLLSNPKAISSRIFGSAAYTGLMMGTSSIPGAGWVATGLTAYGIESQRAYETALFSGATEQEAEVAARATGTANAIGQIVLSTKMLGLLKGEEGGFTRSFASSTNSIKRAMGPAFDLAKDAGVLGGINAIQGAIDDKIATDVYGAENRDPFNWDKRLQEGSIGAITSMLIGAPRTSIKIKKAITDTNGNPTGATADINVFDRDTAYRFFKENDVPTERAKDMAAISDLFASQYAANTGQAKESFYPSVINEKNFELGSNGAALQQKTQSVFDSFEKDPATTLKTLMKASIDTFSADKTMALKESLGITDKTPSGEADQKLDSAMLRYLWNAEPVSPEMVAPMEGLKQMLVDTYKNVTTLGAKKLSLESKIILDSMLASETDAITSTRNRLEGVKLELKKNFPKEFNPASLLSNEDLQSLIEPIREEKVNHEFDDVLNVTKETKETILRRPTTEEMKAKMEELIKFKTLTEQPLSGSSELETQPTLGLIEGVPRSRQEANLLVVDLYNELDRLRMGRLIRDEMSGVERRSQAGQWLRDRYIQETPGDGRDRLDFMQRVTRALVPDSISSMFDKQSPLRKTEGGQMLLDLANQKETLQRLIDGPYNFEGGKKSASLGWQERRWLEQIDKEGFTNLEKVIDQTLIDNKNQAIPSSRRVAIPEKFQNVKDYVDFAISMNRDYARMATQQGTLMRFADGKHRPFQQPEANRFLRLHTNEFREMASNKDSPQWSQFLEYIKNLPGNENLSKMKTEDLSKRAQDVFHDTEARTNSALESARLFKVVPSTVPIDGRPMKIFETNPIRYIGRASRIQADRLAWGQLAGQDVIDKVRDSVLPKIAKTLGVEPANDKPALIRRIRDRVIGTSTETLQLNLQKSTTKSGQNGPVNSAEAVVENLLDHLRNAEKERGSQDVPDPLSDTKAIANAIKIAKDLRINLKPSRQDYLDNINSITATNMTEKQARSLKSAAKQLEGIDTNLPTHELLSEIKSRLNEDTFSVIDNLMKKIDKETGVTNNPHAMRVLKDIQGIPSAAGPELPQTVKAITSLFGSAMTSLRAALHVAQPLWQVAPDAGVGNYLKAMHEVFKERLKGGNSVKDTLNELGAVPNTVSSLGFEKFLSTENLGKLFHLSEYPKILSSIAATTRTLTNRWMGTDLVMNFNNLVVGESYRNYAKGLINRKIVNGRANVTSSDVATLKGLGLSSEEIKGIQGGQMSEVTFAKIVQGGVQRLGTNLPAFKQGRIESSPIARNLLAFSGYAINSGRLISSFMRNNVYEAVKSKDAAMMMRSGRDILTFVGAALGAGALTEVLYSIPRGSEIRQKLKEDDESIVHQATGALMKIAFVGPAARFIEGMQIGGASDIVLSMMPYLHTVGKLIGLFSSNVNEMVTGKSDIEQRFGRYGFGRQVQEFGKSINPAVREWGHTLDNTQYPNKPGYDEARLAVSMYKQKSSPTQGVPKPEAIDPMKNDVYFYVQRGDQKGAVTTAQDYYRDYFEQIKANPRQAVISGMSPQAAVTSLRASLENRAPIDLTENEKLDFLAGLPADRRAKYLKLDIKYRALVDSIAPKERQ